MYFVHSILDISKLIISANFAAISFRICYGEPEEQNFKLSISIEYDRDNVYNRLIQDLGLSLLLHSHANALDILS